MPETPDKVFTIATSDTYNVDEDSPLVMLFTSLSNDPVIEEPATQHLIMNDPELQNLLKGGALIYRDTWLGADSGGFCWKIASEIASSVAHDLESARKGQVVLAYSPKEGIKEHNLYDIYYSCTLPQKSIIGCKGCFESGDNPRDCAIKKLVLTEGEATIGEAFKNLKNRVSRIAGFTYISPRLTLAEDFGKTFRLPEDHDFSVIDYKSQQIQKGIQERKRFNKFEKEVCSQCFVADTCLRQRDKHSRRWCSGPYPISSGDAVVEILNKVHIPFTDAELNYLLLNAYELNKRYNSCKYWTTFAVESKELKFGIVRHTKPWNGVETFADFAEAKTFIEKYGKDIEASHKGVPVNPELKAVLIELAGHRTSPTHRGKWRSTQYYALGITYYAREELRLNFSLGNGRGTAWFNAEAKTLEDVYHHWEDFHWVSHTHHRLSRRSY